MTHAEIYRRAAQHLEKHRHPIYACWTINYIASNGRECTGYLWGSKGNYRRRFERVMLGGDKLMFANQKERILALCFMAAISESLHR